MCSYVASHTYTHTHTHTHSGSVLTKWEYFWFWNLNSAHHMTQNYQCSRTIPSIPFTYYMHVTMHVRSCKYACTYIVHLYMYMHDMHMYIYVYVHTWCTCIHTTSVYVFARKFYRKTFTFLWQYQVWVISNKFKFHRITTKLNYVHVLDYSETQDL